jgi:hypothetical protein
MLYRVLIIFSDVPIGARHGISLTSFMVVQVPGTLSLKMDNMCYIYEGGSNGVVKTLTSSKTRTSVPPGSGGTKTRETSKTRAGRGTRFHGVQEDAWPVKKRPP